MKPYLVDVPVKVNIWIRPECQQRQFEIIKKARPSILFLQSDGGRNEKEWKAIQANRRLFDTSIDWNCEVYRLYEDHNNGLYSMGSKVTQFLWNKVDRCVFLEDDYLPSVSFFSFCAELLEKYKDDLRISRICGMNHCGVSTEVPYDYFFSRCGGVWGGATWKRQVELRKDIYNCLTDYEMDMFRYEAKFDPKLWRRIKHYSKNKYYEGHIAGSEFYKEFYSCAERQVMIVPKKNMICNVGYGDGAEHADDYRFLPRSIQKVFDMETYELDSTTLEHPRFVVPDYRYEKAYYSVLGFRPFYAQSLRRMESIAKRFYYCGSKKTISDVYKRLVKLSGLTHSCKEK